MNTASARPGASWGGLSFALHAVQRWAAMSLLYSPPMIRRLCAVLRPASDIFASTSSRADKPQKQIRRKGHLQVRRAVLSSGSISSILPATKTSHSGPQGRHARHKATPAHSTRSKPGYCYLLRARDSTAQRDLSTSHQAHIFFLHSTPPL